MRDDPPEFPKYKNYYMTIKETVSSRKFVLFPISIRPKQMFRPIDGMRYAPRSINNDGTKLKGD